MNKVFSSVMLKGIRCASLLPLLSLTAAAQTATWQQVQSGMHSWQDPLNWSTGSVPNGTATSVSFSNNPLGAQTLTLDEDVVLGGLSFSNSRGSYSLIPNGLGGALIFDNEGNGVTISNAGTASNFVWSNLDLVDATHTFAITDGRLIIDGIISGSNGLSKTGDGWLVLRRTNTYTGETLLEGGITLVSQANDNNAVLGATGTGNGTIILPGATLALVNDGSNASSSTTGGASLNSEAVSVSGSGYLNNGAIRSYAGREQNQLTGAVTVTGDTRFQSQAGTLAFTSTVNLGENNLRVGGTGFVSLSGAVQGTGTITHFGISGFRLQNTGASNTFSGAIVSELGEVRAENSDANGLTPYDNISSLTVKNGFLNIMAPTSGTFTVKSRVPDALPITLQAGRIRIESLSFNSTNGFAWAETVGDVTATQGHTYFDFRDTNADSGTRVLTVTSLTRSSPAVTFRLGGDGNVATNIGNGTLGNRYRFFNSALDGGGNVPFVGGWAYLNAEFMKYNDQTLGGNGYRALEAGDYFIDQAEATWDASRNVKITAANRTLALNTTIQSLNMDTRAVTNTPGRTLGGSAGVTLVVESGGLLTSGGTHTISVPFLTAGATSDYHLYDIAWSSNIFRSVVADNAGNPVTLVKAGGATTSFLAANTYTGTTDIQEGVLRDVIGARGIIGLGSGNLSFTGSPINQAVYENDRDFTRGFGAGAGQVQFLSGSGVGFSAYGAPINVNFGGAGDPVVWGSTHFNPGLFTLNGGNATHVVTLVNPVDLNNEQRYIRIDGGASGGNRASIGIMAGDIFNGGVVKRGGGVLVFDSAKTYTQGTIINEGEIWLRGQGTAGANVIGNDILIGSAARLKLDGPANVGSRQLISMLNQDDNNASAISFGPGYGDGSSIRFHTFLSEVNDAAQLGAHDIYIHNQQTGDNRRNRVAVQISGLHNFSADVMDQIVNVAPDVEAWFGADTGNGTFTGASLPATGNPLRPDNSAKPGNNRFFRLGSGGGTITLANANVLDGAYPLIVGAEDNTGRVNIGGLVYLPQSQNYSGTVTQTVGTAVTAGNLIGSGGVLVVGGNGALNNANNNISLRGGEIRFGINAANSFLGGVDSQYAARNLFIKSANAVVRTIPITGGMNGVLQLNDLTMRMDDADRVLTLNSIGTHYTQTVFNGSVTLENGNTNARNAFFDVGNDNSFQSGLGILVFNGVMSQTGAAAVNLQKRQGGVLVLKNDNTYNGTTNVQQGRLVIAHPGAAGNAGTTINMNTNSDRRSDLEFLIDGTGPFVINNLVNTTGGNDNSTRVIRVGSLDGSSSNQEIRLTSLTSAAGGATTTGNTASALYFDSNQGYRLTVTGATTLTRTLTDFRTRGALLTLEGAVGGAGALHKYEQGTLVLAGNNAYTGATAIYGGYLVAASDTAFGNASSAITFNGGSFGQLLASGTRTINRAITNSASGSTQTIGGLDAGAKTFSGAVTLTRGINVTAVPGGDVSFTGVLSGAGDVTMAGTGNVILNNSNTYTGATMVANGTLIGRAQASGSPFGNNSVFTISNGALWLENSTGGSNNTATTGALNVTSGNATIVVDNAASTDTTLTFGSLVRTNNATVVLRGATTDLGTAGNEKLAFTAAPAVAKGTIGTWAVIQSSGNAGHYAGFTGGNIVTASYTASGVDLNTAAGASDLLDLSGVGGNLAADRTVYAFRTDTEVALNGNTLKLGDAPAGTVGQAGMILNNGADVQGGTVDIGTNALSVYTDDAAVSTFSAAITNFRNNANNTLTTRLVKFGPGTLELSSATSSYQGNIQVSQGTLSLTAPNVIPTFANLNAVTGSTVIIQPGATVRLNGNNQEFGNLSGTVVVSPVLSTAGTLDLGSATLTFGRQGSSTTFSGQLIGDAGSRLVKVGGGRLTLNNWDASRPNSLETLEVLQGVVQSWHNDNSWATPNGFASSLPSTTQILLRGGEWEAYVVGDNTSNFQFIPMGQSITARDGNAILDTNRWQGSTANKILGFDTLTVDKNLLTITGGNAIYPRFAGAFTMTANARLQTDAPLLLNGTINGYYTLTKTGASNLEINADNSAWSGGTVLHDGTLLFGSRTPEVGERYMAGTNLFSYSATANLGTGDIVVNRSTAIRLNAPSNVLAGQGQRVQTFSSLTNGLARVDLGLNAPVTDYNLRSTANGALTVGLNDGFYTHTLDQSLMGNGRWALGAWTTTFYTASKLGHGIDNTYRFAGVNGVLNITQANALSGPASLEVGMDMTPNGFAINSGNAQVQLYGDQSYTGNTIIRRNRETGSTQNFLAFHGDLASPVIDVYGRLMARGAGRFTNDAGDQVNTVNLYPGSVLRFDYNMDVNDSMATSRLENSNLGLSTTENKWGDSTPLLLDGATLNLLSSSGRVNREAVGAITVRNGAAVLLERNGTNGQIVLETPSITREGQATFAVRENANELGRVDLQGQKFFIDNGASMLDGQNLLPVWMINPTRNTFLTYNANLGVQNANFTDSTTTAATGASFLAGLTATSVANYGVGVGDATLAGTVNVHALRIAHEASGNDATLTGGQINIHSGGLIVDNRDNARVNFNTTNVYFGDGSTPVEALVYSDQSNITTRFGGVVTAANFTMHGAGNVQLSNTGNLITGNIQVNSGKLFLDGAGSAGNSNVSITLAGDWLQNNDGQQMAELWLRTNNNANTTWNNSLVIAQNVPYARIIGGRYTGTSTATATNTISGSLTINGTNTLQGTTLIVGSTGTGSSENTHNLTIAGATTLGGSAPIGIRVEQSGRVLQLTGAVTGSAPILKSGDGTLRLDGNNTTLSSPVTLNRGEIRGIGNNTNNFFGTGDYTLNFGTLRISHSLGVNAFYFGADGQDIVIGGAVNMVNDRNGGAGRSVYIGTNNGTNTVRTVNGAQWRVTSDSSDSVVFESKIFVNDAAVFFTDNAPTWFRDTFEGAGRFTKVGVSQILFDNNVANSNWTGTIDIQAGYIRVQQALQTLGGAGSSIILNPAAGLSVHNVGSLGTGQGISQLRTTSRTSATVLGGLNTTNFDALRAHYNSLTSIGTGVGVLTLNGTQNWNIADPAFMANFRDGNWNLGTLHDTATLIMNSLLPWGQGGNKFLLGGGSSTLVLNPTTAGSDQLAGAGNQAIIGIPHTYFGYSTVVIGANGNNSFDGGTFVTRSRNLDGSYRGTVLSIQGGAVGTTTDFRSPLGSGAVEVFGEIRIEGASGTAANSATTNANTWTFHPGTRIRFDNNTPFTGSGTTGNLATGTLGGGGRWGDNVPINLNASVVEMFGDGTDHIANREVVGDISASRGSEVVIRRTGANWAELSAGNLTRGSNGTLMITTMVDTTNTAGILGTVAGAASATRFLISNSGDLIDNNMVAPWVISRFDGQFLKYDNALGFQILTQGGAPSNYVATSTTTLTSGVLGANDGSRIVSLEGDNNFTLGENLDIHALRIGRDLNVSADGLFNKVVIRSGGLTQYANTPTLNADIDFGIGGTGEALIHASNNTLQINGRIRASQVTKFGTQVLNIRGDQPLFTGNWVVNGGGIQFLTPGAPSTGEVILNGSRANDRDNTFSLTEVRYNFNSGSPDLFTWNGGKITGYDVNRIYMPTASDRLQQIPAVDLRTTNAVAGTGQPGLMIFLMDGARSTVRTGTVTLHDHYQVQVESNSYGTGSTVGFQFGAGDGTGGLNNQGLYDLSKTGDGVLTLGNNTASFTGGRSITIGEGAVRVLHAGAFGGAGNTGNIEQGGALEIAVAGWSPSATLVQQSGSIERWAVNGARSGDHTLPSGVHLQIMANQTGTKTITLDGGSLMGYLPRDWDHVGIIHQLGSGITLNLASNSFLGQPYASSNNSLWDQSRLYDIGKINQTNASNPNDMGLRGSYLQIHGNITGPGGLTKVGQDIILLNGANSYEGSTVVENGVLQIGRNNSLPVGTDLRLETSSGMFDLNGFNQEVASLAGDQGSVNNGAFALNTLTVNQASDSTYGGTLDGNVSLVKGNTGVLSLAGVSAMRGDLIISGGSVALTGSGSVNESRWISVGSGASFDLTGRTGGGYTYDGLISGGGVGALRVDNANRGRIFGSISLADNVGTHARTAALKPGGSSGGAYATAGDQIGHLQVTGDLSLSGGLYGSTTKTERLTLQLAAPTSTLAALGWDGSALAAWLTANAAPVLNGEQGDLSGHDYVNVGGAATLNEHGTVGVALTNGYTPAFGDIFNLLDWTTITANTFNAGPANRVGGESGYDLNLPDLSAYQLGWNTDLFLSHGVLVVAPEPGRMLLVFLGLAGLCLRRRR